MKIINDEIKQLKQSWIQI